MLVTNKQEYASGIYSAIVVNDNVTDDPSGLNRVQIYIPTVHYEYKNKYSEYMTASNKSEHECWTVFPWAVRLINKPKLGDVVYGSYIANASDQFIILGFEGGEEASAGNVDTSGDIVGSEIVDLAMPIILKNEIGLNDLSAWGNDTIPESEFKSITLHDGKSNGWAIGLIQWNGTRAFDTMYEICKEDPSWENIFTANTDLKSDLKSAISVGNTGSYRGSYASNFNPEKNGSEYNSISAVLGSSKSRPVQRRLASEATGSTIAMLMENEINNPAILIYLADLMNQYGTGLPDTIKRAKLLCADTSKSMIQQLDELISSLKSWSTWNTYASRRNATYGYVMDLYNAGRLNFNTDIDGTSENENAVSGTGQYSIPFEGTHSITSSWGGNGYPSGGAHAGLDFGMPSGTKIFACTDGEANYKTTQSGFGKHVLLYSDDGNLIVFGHLSTFNGDTRPVKKGDLLGYSGNTGNSHGPHLHLGVTRASTGESGLWNRNWSSSLNPAPFLGISDAVGTVVKGV